MKHARQESACHRRIAWYVLCATVGVVAGVGIGILWVITGVGR